MTDEENLPGVVSSGDVVAEAEIARDFDTLNPTDETTVFDQDSAPGENTQDTNAEPSVTPIPDRFDYVPGLPGANNPFQNFAENAFGGILGTGGSKTSAASVTQSRVERNTQSFVYRAVQITSRFSQGRFTQDLQGVILNFDDVIGNTNVNTNNAVDYSRPDADPTNYGYGYGEQSQFNTGSQNTAVDVDRDSETLDNTGGSGPAESEPTTNSDGQDIGIENTANGSEENTAAQVIARDD